MSADALLLQTELLQAVTEAMTELLRTGDPRAASSRVLRAALQQTGSQYGFAGVTDGRALRILNHEGVTWHDDLNRQFYEEALQRYQQVGYLEFTNFNNLFGAVLTTGRAVTANHPSHDDRAGGLPPGHPQLNNFLGVPILSGDRIVGLIGVANRASGYGAAEQHRLEVLAQMAGVIYDAYGRQQREADLQEQLRQAQKMEAVGRLAGGIAHDFNNLLTVISGYNDMMLVQIGDDKPISGDLHEIRKAAESAAALTRQLLVFSRTQMIRMVAVDLKEVISNAEQLLRRTLGEDVNIVMNVSPDTRPIQADDTQLQQVIMNLAVNARDAMPRGGTLAIETANVDLTGADISTHPGLSPGRYVRLTVSDTGCGMDATTKEHIFEPFFTTKDRGHGTGLGLATVYGIVKQAGGGIVVYSEVGHGTTFKLYFPESRTSIDRALPATKVRPTNLVGSETVLLVEDDESVRLFAVRLLRRYGYRVHEAASPAEALLVADDVDEAIDLLLTDIIMPGIDGCELVERVSATRPETCLLYMSGYPDQTILRRGLSIDPGELLEKPFTSTDLLRKVREVLDAKSAGGSVLGRL
jgi:signal transduction histidine kinase/ActR/RegA family two-component response regulator